MKVKLLVPSLVGNDMHDAGEIVEITDENKAKFMLDMKQAAKVEVAHPAPHPTPITPKVKP